MSVHDLQNRVCEVSTGTVPPTYPEAGIKIIQSA